MNQNMRIYHRYLGFFLAGIMAVYALSGIVMIFRTTDAFKVEKQVQKEIQPNLNADLLGRELRIKNLKIEKEEGDVQHFAQGSYNKKTGFASYKVKELPVVLEKLTNLHKATTNSPLFFLNIFFGLSLLFFVVSAFFMFIPKTSAFKKGLYFSIAGLVLALVMIFVG